MRKLDFPVFTHQPSLTYLDSAATTLRPEAVIRAVSTFTSSTYGPIHRGLYPLSVAATEIYEQTRADVARFIGASSEEIIFTSGATDSLNQICWSVSQDLGPGDTVLVSPLEHHSALLPWQEAAKTKKFRLEFCKLTENGEITITKLDPSVRAISLPLISNVTGSTFDYTAVAALAKQQNALFILDASQAVGHLPLNIANLGCDFLVFSAHKMYGPTGVGVLWGKREHLENMLPYRMGGEMVNSVTKDSMHLADIPHRFEAGTPNADGVIGLGAAISYLNSVGMEKVQKHAQTMTNLLFESLENIQEVSIVGAPSPNSGLVSFTVDGIHPHDISDLSGRQNICIRAGQQCAGPAHQYLNLAASCRASTGVYTEERDIEIFISTLKEIITEISNA